MLMLGDFFPTSREMRYKVDGCFPVPSTQPRGATDHIRVNAAEKNIYPRLDHGHRSALGHHLNESYVLAVSHVQYMMFASWTGKPGRPAPLSTL